jgi:uncharacterized HAD superfamily protein
MSKGKGLRYNSDKLRLSLVPTDAIEGIAHVLTYGANKYTYTVWKDKDGNIMHTETGESLTEIPNTKREVISGANNWRLGMAWTTVIDSLERHLLAFKNGEDFDEESGKYHIDHLLTNAAFLKTYYRIYPQGDDRLHSFKHIPRIGLDIDDCLNYFVEYFCEKFNLTIPDNWYFDLDMSNKLKELSNDKFFWLNIPPKINSKELKFEPECYITARSIPLDWTEEWLKKHNFPIKKIHSVGFGNSKLEIAKKENLDFFIDDKIENFVELNSHNIFTLLFDTNQNKKYNVGFKRILNIEDFQKRFL